AGRLVLERGRVGSGVVDGLAIDDGVPLGRITVVPGAALDALGVELALRDRDRHVRLADGRVVDGIHLRWRDGQGQGGAATAMVTVVDDLAPLRAAIASLAGDDSEGAPLSHGNFNRARLVSALFGHMRMQGHTACCDSGRGWPRPTVEAPAPDTPTQGPARAFAAFFPQCGGCHA